MMRLMNIPSGLLGWNTLSMCKNTEECKVINYKAVDEDGRSSDGEEDQELQETTCEEMVNKNFRLHSGHPKLDKKVVIPKVVPAIAEIFGPRRPKVTILNC